MKTCIVICLFISLIAPAVDAATNSEGNQSTWNSERITNHQIDDIDSAFKTFDPNYNDKDIKELSRVVRYNRHDGNDEGVFGHKEKPLRVISPYIERHQGGVFDLTNVVDTPSYKTRKEEREASEKKFREYMRKNKTKKEDIYTLPSKDSIRKKFEAVNKSFILMEYPKNDSKNYNEFNKTPGFPKKIPSFAKNVNFHINPGFLQAGSYLQLAYIEEAISNSKVIVPKNVFDTIYVKQYIDSDLEYADTLSVLVPEKMIVVKPTTIQMGRYMKQQEEHPLDDLVNQAYNEQKLILEEFNKEHIEYENETEKLKRFLAIGNRIEKERISSSKNQISTNETKKFTIYSERENQKLQKKYLGYVSFEEEWVNIPDDYIYYLFDFGGNWNHPYALGAAVSPNKDYIIYFYQAG